MNSILTNPSAVHYRARFFELLRLQQGANIFQQAEQMVGIGWRRNKIEVFIKGSSPVVLGVDGEGANTGNVSRLKRAQHCVFEQGRPKSLPLPCQSDGKTSQQHDRNRMTGESLGQAFMSAFVHNLPHNQGVVAGYLIVRQHEISPGCAGLLILECEAYEESIQWLTAAIKCIDQMAAVEFFESE